ncbi:hypothetical protein PIB30_077404 [Stylosanthes scabra]|uniref:Uncharacterized protein n=1 Tax=Stylosanthes scabra TaxID=79078 RepID=A0ABU6RQC6_9FABA|nr:hypothetical protein [Stylosanthes scabra]
MAKKKSCQNIRRPRLLKVVERELYDWVEEVVFSQPSVILGDSLPELHHDIRLTTDMASEGDYVLKLQALPTVCHSELARIKEVMTRCRVAASQLYLNGWGFMRTFECVCLHFEFRPSCRIFMYIYDLLPPPTGLGFMSFRAHQGRHLFYAFEESIQEFKWHYFKVLPTPRRRPFWLDDEGNLFPWVYWNPEVKDFHINNLDTLEAAACRFLLSLPAGLGKKHKFTYRWILDHNDQNKLDCLKSMMANVNKMGPRSILLAPVQAVATSNPPRPSSQAAMTSISSGGPITKWVPSKKVKPKTICIDGEEGVKEDPADLQQKRRKRNPKDAELADSVLGDDSAWEHDVHPVDLAFPEN